MNNYKKTGTLAILVEDKNVLLGLKKKGHGIGKWNGFGGKATENETYEQAMKRELSEEAGVEAIEYKHMGTLDFKNSSNDEWKVLVYIVTKWSGDIKESEEMKPQWFNLDEIPYENMWPDDKEWLPPILRGEKVKAAFILDRNSLKEFNMTLV